jgi:hypothetical protein
MVFWLLVDWLKKLTSNRPIPFPVYSGATYHPHIDTVSDTKPFSKGHWDLTPTTMPASRFWEPSKATMVCECSETSHHSESTELERFFPQVLQAKSLIRFDGT